MAFLPAPVLELAARQFQIVTMADLLALRRPDDPESPLVSRAVVDGWVAHGYLEKAHRGVYRLAGTTGIPGQKHYAAMRRGGTGSRLGGPSGLAFLGAEGFDLLGADDPFVLIRPGRRLVNVSFSWLPVVVPTCDAAMLPGKVPSVTPTRALIESCAVVDPKRVRVAYDDLRRRGLMSRERLVERAHLLRSVVPGADVALDIAASGDLDKESEGERQLATVFVPTDPWPLWQAWVLPDVRVDGFFPEARLALEYYGRKHHTITEDRRRDAARAARLESEAGVEVLVVWDVDLRDRAALRARILDRRAERIRAGVTPLRDFRLEGH